MKKLYFLPFFLFCCFLSYGQTKGLIYKPASTAAGRAVLDPNGDGYTSKTTAGFKTNDRGNGESEIAYKSIPILENEPIQDPLRGPGCGFTDMVDSGIGDPVMFYFDGTNFLVRFRLNKTSPNSKGYSVLIDTDQKFGFTGPNADPNAVAGNPGFEKELVLMSNHGVALYNIDGTTNPTLVSNQDYDSHAQKSIAYTEQCGDMDYFYDFYMPWSAFGLPVDTKLRMVALTVMNPMPSMGNNAKSDVGGVDDRKYGGNYDKLFEDFIQNYNPTSPQDNNSGISARTLCPSVDAGVTVTSTSITGTSTEASGTAITVYKNGVAFASKAYVTTSGTWSLSVTGLAEGDVITASAKATSKEESESNCSGVLVGQVCTRPAAPTLSGSNGNSNKYVTIVVPVDGYLDLYLGNVSLLTKTFIAAGTYYYCPAGGLGTKTNTCSGGNNLDAGVYRATFTVGSCTSNSAFLCVNTTTASATPTINSPITTATKFITGTAVANAQVILKVNGAEKVRLTASATGKWSVPASSLALASGNTISAYALEDGKCQSAETAAITVTQPVSIAPSISGTYCGTSTTISGTSAEAAGTTIKLYLNGSATALATTTTGSIGNWSITGVSVSPGSTLTAKATAAGKTESAASVTVTVKSVSSNSGITINSTTDPVTSEKYIMEDATSISGTAPGGSGTISLYLDEMFIGSGTLSGGNWTVTKAAFPNDFYLFAGASLTATFTATGGCESDFTVPTVAIRCAPPADRTVTPSSTVECTGATPQVTVNASESFLIYQLYNGSTPISSSILGNGSNIVLNTTTPLTATAANTLVNLRVVASKIPYVAGVTCDRELTQQVAVTLNPVIENNTISLPSTGSSYCGATNVGTITGSTPTGGNGTYTYQWQSNASGTWADISGATGKDFNPSLVSTTTSYRRKVFSAACSNEDASASVEVKILAAVTNNVSYTGQTVFCGSGTPSQLQGNTDGSFTSYQWQYSLDGSVFQNISGATAATYSPGNLTQTTTFRRVISNGTCESYSANIAITVNPAIANNSITAPATTILCTAGSVGEITGSAPTGGNGAYTYKWQISTDNGVSYTDISPAVTTANYTPANVSATTYFKRLVSSGACANAESNVVKITVVSAAQTTITADATTLAANGTSTTTIRVQLKDAFGADVNTAACNLTLNADKGTISNLVNAGDGTYTATYTSATTDGLATVLGTLNSNSLTKTAQITLNPALNLAATTISASPTTLYANGTSTATATVSFKDYAGNAIAVDAAKVAILLNSVAATSISDLGNGVFTVVVPAQASPTTITVTATYDGAATSGSATVNFIAEPVVVPNPSMVNSTVTANPTTVNADNVSTATAYVQFKDASGDNLVVDATKVTIYLNGVSVSYTDKGNGLFEAVVPARTIAATVNVTANYDGASVNNSATVTFVPVVNPELTVVTAASATVNADGTSTSTVTVTYKDYAGNPIAVAPADASVLLNGSTVSITPNGTGVYTATVPARTIAETVNVTATYKGAAVSSTASVTFVPALNLAATVVTASPVTVNADGTSTSLAIVSFKDYAGNAIAVETAKVKLLLDNVSVTIAADGTGSYKATVPARTIAQTVLVTAKYDATDITDDASVTFVPALNLAATEVTVTPNQVAANGSSTATAKVVFKNYSGNPIAVDAAKVNLLLDGVSVSISTASAGTFTAVVPARTSAATVTVTATYDGAATGGSPTVEFVPALNLAATTLVANPATVNADGTSTSTATLSFKDYAGNAIAVDAAKVAMLLDGTGVTASSLGNGVFEVTVPASTTAKTVQVTAKYDGASLSATASVEFVPALNLAATVVAANPITVNADGSSTSLARVTFKDYAGNNFAVDASKVELLEGGAALAGLQDKGNGVFEATIPARTTAESVTITAKYNSSPTAGSATVNFVAVVNLAQTTIQASPTTVAADGSSTSVVTITFKDYAGNVIAIDPGKLNILLSGAGVTFSSTSTGVYTATVPARTSAATVVASATYDGATLAPTATVAFVPALNLAATVVTATPTVLNADGSSNSMASVQFKDYADNTIAVDAAKVSLLLDGVAVTVSDKGNGLFEAEVPARTTTQTVAVTATYDGATVSSSASVQFVPAVNFAATELTALPATVAADGTSTSTATLHFKDYAGNAIAVDASKVKILLDNVAASIASGGTGVFVATVPARTTAETVQVTATYDASIVGSNPSVTFIPALNLAATTISASPTTLYANGTSTATATVNFKDYAGNPIAVDATKVAILLNSVAATSISDLGNGVFTVVVPAQASPTTITVTAKYEGAATGGSATVNFIAEPVVVPVPNLANSTITANPTTVNANGTSTSLAAVQFKDDAGDNLEVDAAKVEVFLDGVSVSFANKGGGLFEATIPARTTAANVQVTAKYDGSSLTASASVAFVPTMNLAVTTLVANPTIVPANGVATATATLAFKDYAGNAIEVDAAKVSMQLAGSNATVTAKGNGVYEATVPARTTAETVSVTASYDGAALSVNANVEFVPALNLAATTLVANPTTVAANGVSTSKATLSFKDYAGNAFSVDAAKVSMLLDGVVTSITSLGGGVYEVTVPAFITAKTVQVTAKYDGASLSATASVEFIPALNLAATVVSASPITVKADGLATSTAKVEFKDYAGNAFAVDAAKVQMFGDAVILAGLTDKGNGVFEAIVPARTNASTVEITATYDGASITDKASVSFVPTMNLAVTTLVANPTIVPANGVATATATLAFKDYAGNAIEVDAAKLAILLNSSSATFQSLGNGAYKVIVPGRTNAETVVITAKYDGVDISSSASVSFLPVVNLAATSLQVAPTMVAANGTSTATATLQFKDYAGNAIAVDAAKVAILLDGVANSATAKGTGKYELTIPARTIAQVVQVKATYDGATVASTETVTFVPAVDLSKTVVSASPTSVNADGVSTATATVVFKDYAGNTIDVKEEDVALLLNGTASGVTRSAVGTYTLTIPARTTAETVQVTATYEGSTVGSAASVDFVPVVNLAATTLTAAPSVVVADGASIATVTLQFKDYAGNAIAVDDSKVSILLDGVSVSINPGSTGEYKATVPARTTVALITATAIYDATTLSPSATVEFTPVVDVAATLVSANPTTVNADGVSTSLVTVTFKDMAGNAINVDASKVSILLNGTPVTATAKGNGVYEATIPARILAETVEVTAKYDGEVATNKATVRFVPVVNVAATTVTANPLVVNADGTSTSTATVSFKDYAGNAIEVDASKVEVLLNSITAVAIAKGNGVFEVEIPARTVAEQVEVTAKYNGSFVSSKAIVEFVPALNLSATTLVANPVTVNADGTSTSIATLRFKDYAGNAIAVDAAKVAILLDGAGATVTDLGNGMYEAIVPASTTAKTVQLTATYDGATLAPTATVEFVPALNLAATVVTATPTVVNADGSATSTASVQFKDYAGNAIAVDAAKVSLLLDGVAVTVSDKGNGLFEAEVPARTTAQTVAVTAKYDGATVSSTASVEFIPVLNVAATTIVADPTTVNADGKSTSTVTITFKDYAGNPIEVEDAKLEVKLNGVVTTFIAGSAGVYTAIVPARTTAEKVEVTGVYDGAEIASKATVIFMPALNFAATVVSSSPASLLADGTSTATAKVEFKDYAGNAITVDPAKVAIMLDGVAATFTEKGNGILEATVPARNTAAIVEVTAAYDGTPVTSKAQVEFIHVPVLSVQLSTVVANPTTVVADGTSTSQITVQLKDGDGNNFTTTETVTITSDFGTVSTVTNNGNGNYTATIASANIGAATITVTVGAVTLEAKPTVNFVIGNASATTSTITASKASIPADGVSTSVITVTLFDAQNRRITTGGDNVILSSTLGTLGAVTDNNDGTYTATLTSGTIAGNAVVSGKVNGVNMSNSVTVTFTALPIPNRAPVAQDDQFTVNNHEKLTGNVLTNDSDPDGNPLTVKTSLIRQPMFGTVVMQANGRFTYTPNKGYAGTDSFTYEVCDNASPALCAQATVSILVVQGQVFIPEGFSPDGDGENDTFVIYGAEKYKVSLKVFNRWGDVVYDNKVYKNDWDGTAQKGLVLGDKLPDGTYFYIVDLNNGEKPRTHSLIIKRK